MLKVKELNTYYEKVHVLKNISLEVKKGEKVLILGRNGAGKTTLLKSIINLVKPASGEIFIDGINVTGWPTHKIVSLGVGYAPQENIVFPELTVIENLQVRLGGRKVDEDRLKIILNLFPYLADKLERKAGTLSGGEQRMLNIARALISPPKLVLADEPLIGLMPKVCESVMKFLNSMCTEGTSVVIVEPRISKQLLEFADKIYIMETGNIVYEGDPEKVSEELLVKHLGAVVRH